MLNIEKKYLMVIQEVDSNRSWEEELTNMVVSKNSPHIGTYKEGIHHFIPIDLTKEQVQHYAENLVDWYNKGLRPGETARRLVSTRIEQI